MTVKDYADNHGLARQTIYRRIKKIQEQQDLDDTALIDKRGHLTDTAIQLFAEYYDTDDTNETTEGHNRLSDADKQIDMMQQTIDAQQLALDSVRLELTQSVSKCDSMQHTIDNLQTQLEAAQHVTEALEKQIADLQQDKQNLYGLLAQANTQQQRLIEASTKKRFKWPWQKKEDGQ